MDKIIKKVGTSKSQFRTSAVTGLASIVVGAALLLYSIAEELEAYLIVCFAICVVSGIPMVIRTYNIGRCSLCICEDKLYGTSGNANFYKSFQFEIGYNEIVSLKLKSNLLSIEKRDTTLFVYVEDGEEVKELIEQRMANQR